MRCPPYLERCQGLLRADKQSMNRLVAGVNMLFRVENLPLYLVAQTAHPALTGRQPSEKCPDRYTRIPGPSAGDPTNRIPSASNNARKVCRCPLRDFGTPSAASYRLIVAVPMPVRSARSATDQPRTARAAFNCTDVSSRPCIMINFISYMGYGSRADSPCLARGVPTP